MSWRRRCVDHDHDDEDEDEDDDELEDADLAVLAKHGLTREDFHNLVRLACSFLPLLQGLMLHVSELPLLSTAMANAQSQHERYTRC